jgi:signal transduction histidine kinase
MNTDRDDERERLLVLGEIAAEIAHELRNVLQVITSTAYLARHEIAKNDAAASAAPHVAKIERNARVAHAIVDDLMALARGEPLGLESTAVADLAAAARSGIPEGAAVWQDAWVPDDLRVDAHAGLTVRLMHVLYENAIHASAPRPPLIKTGARTTGDKVVIEVTDDGPGIPAEVASRIFEPFVTTRAGGTGLGLALARRIAAAEGGVIEHVPAAAGATFRLTLPRGR